MVYLLVSILIIIIIVIYLYYYTSANIEYNITQTFLTDLNVDILNEKNPIIVYDQVRDPYDLLNTLFKYTYWFKSISSEGPGMVVANSKYTIIWHSKINESIMVNLISPKYIENIKGKNFNELNADTQYVSIKMKHHQLMIVPNKWIYVTENEHEKIELDGLITVLLKGI